jgi:hypothetical protein
MEQTINATFTATNVKGSFMATVKDIWANHKDMIIDTAIFTGAVAVGTTVGITCGLSYLGAMGVSIAAGAVAKITKEAVISYKERNEIKQANRMINPDFEWTGITITMYCIGMVGALLRYLLLALEIVNVFVMAAYIGIVPAFLIQAGFKTFFYAMISRIKR